MASEFETSYRIMLGLMVLGAVLIGAPHRIRADRAGGRVSPKVDPGWFWLVMGIIGPPVVVTYVAFMINPRWVDFARIDLPDWLLLAGAPVAVGGVALFCWMFRNLGLNVTSTSMPRTNATLVTTGPYRWVRHPMYSAALLLLLAAGLLTANFVVLFGGMAMFSALAGRSRLEEERLVLKFGDAYRTYRARTGRFVPRLRHS